MRHPFHGSRPWIPCACELHSSALRALFAVIGGLWLAGASRATAQTADAAGAPVNALRSSEEAQLTMIPDGSGGAYVSLKSATLGLFEFNCPVTVVHLLANGGSDPAWSATPLT